MRLALFVLCQLPLVLAHVQSPLLSNPSYESHYHSNSASAYTTYRSTASPSHSIRIKPQNDTLCDARTKQYTGWLDVGPAHLFFWYFESANDPANDPLTLWLTGGPGGSSMLGLFQELGPCLVNSHGNGTVHNPYGWTYASTNMLFVDQPAPTGFSYLDEGAPLPIDSLAPARDMTAFMQLFVNEVFPEKANVPFHISGESYAGHWIPALGAEIVRQNKLRPWDPQVPLKSLMLGNGYVSPMDSTFGFWETLCTTKPGVKEPVFNQTRCDIMAENMPACLEGMKVCYEHPSLAVCQAVTKLCTEGVMDLYEEESYKGGRDRFDITHTCEVDIWCYNATINVQDYLNRPEVFRALDVPSSVTNFSMINWAINGAFDTNYDLYISTRPQVQYVLANEVDVLVYQGNLDLACSTAGNYRWSNNMPWKGQTEYASKSLKPWTAEVDSKKKEVGSFKEVNIKMKEGSDRKTRFAFVTIDGAGHMAPANQPAASLEMVRRWLVGESF